MENVFWEAHSESDEEESFEQPVTFNALKKTINKHYEPSIIHNYSSALDILASYIKSQSFIYNEASNFCRFRLNMLMFPCIFLSSLCSVLSSANEKINHGILYISGINAFISFLLSIINFLKLDASSEAHQISSNHYSKLRTILEFSSGEVLLFSNPLLESDGIDKEMTKWKETNNIEDYKNKSIKKRKDTYDEQDKLKNKMIEILQDKISDIRKKVIEIRESNRFSIPKYISCRYPVIFNINIFSFIKTVSDYRDSLICSLKNVRNELRFIKKKQDITEEDTNRIKELYKDKQDIMKEIFALSSTHNLIDIMFQQEIKNNLLFRDYYYLFYTQYAINFICCNSSTNFLPNDYKHPYDCGYYDEKNNTPLLRKIMNIWNNDKNSPIENNLNI